MEENKNTGVLIGRFQVDDLSSHHGYLFLLDQALSTKGKIIVLLGTTEIPDHKNPLSYMHRKAMFNEAYPTIIVREIKDVMDDALWTKNVDKLVDELTEPDERVTLCGGRDSFIYTYNKNNGKYETEYLEKIELIHASATEVRTSIKDSTFSNRWVRFGLIQAEMKRYATMYPTVDVIVTRNNGKEVLLGQKAKEIGSDLWRCVGGFIEPGNKSGKNAAARELEEEANLFLNAKDFKYVSQVEITEDPRYKWHRDSIMTTVFTVECPAYMDATGGDDLPLVQWFNVEDVVEFINPIHKQVWDEYLEYYTTQKEQAVLWAEFLAFKANKELVTK